MKLTLFSLCPQPITTETVPKNVVDVVSDRQPRQTEEAGAGRFGAGRGFGAWRKAIDIVQPWDIGMRLTEREQAGAMKEISD